MSGRPLWIMALVSCSALLPAQVTIYNPQNLDVPRAKVNVIYHMTLRVLSDTLDLADIEQLYPVTLTLGADEERYVEDEDKQLDAIFLKKWDEKKFAISVMRLALEHLVNRECRNEIVSDILNRSDLILPAHQQRR